MPLSKTVVIFDLDGTLVDSARDLAQTLNHILAGEKLPPLAPDMVRHMVGHGAIAMMHAGFVAAGRSFPDAGTPDHERLREAFLQHYRAHIADHTVPFEGCLNALTALSAAGAKLAVCTNKFTEPAIALLTQLNMADSFEEILGRDALPQHKPAPEPLLDIMHRTARPQAVMIGDSYTDRDAARGAAIPCCLATFGYGALDEPLKSNERLFSHYDDLPKLVLELADRPLSP